MRKISCFEDKTLSQTPAKMEQCNSAKDDSIMFYQRGGQTILTKKRVDWLIDHTKVDYFNPINNSGYQRRIDDDYCKEIADNIMKNGLASPSPIICSCRDIKYNNNDTLYIMDGQHRIEAFKWIRENNKTGFKKISHCELPVVIVLYPTRKREIESFIEINKNSNKIDTSLAEIIKTNIRNARGELNDNFDRCEGLLTDIAWKLNYNDKESLWYDKILFNGSTATDNQTLGVYDFTKATKSLVDCLERHKVLNCEWESESEYDASKEACLQVINKIWECAKLKWEPVLTSNVLDPVLLGPIGCNAINKAIVYKLDYAGKNDDISIDNCKTIIEQTFEDMDIDETKWLPKGRFSQFSSEAGYSIVAMELVGI